MQNKFNGFQIPDSRMLYAVGSKVCALIPTVAGGLSSSSSTTVPGTLYYLVPGSSLIQASAPICRNCTMLIEPRDFRNSRFPFSTSFRIYEANSGFENFQQIDACYHQRYAYRNESIVTVERVYLRSLEVIKSTITLIISRWKERFVICSTYLLELRSCSLPEESQVH